MIDIPICNTNKEHQSGLQYFLNKLMKNQTTSKSSHQSCSIERAVLKNFGNSHRKTHVPESLILQPQPRTLLKKRLWHSVFLWILRNKLNLAHLIIKINACNFSSTGTYKTIYCKSKLVLFGKRKLRDFEAPCE